MNLFFRDFTAASPISSGSKWVAALGGRIAYAFAGAVYGRLTSAQTWVVAVLIGCWFATSVFPATAGLAAVVNAILIGFGAIGLLKSIKEIATKLIAAINAAYLATNEKELDKAAELFTGAMDEYALNSLSAIVNQATFLKIEKAVLAVFPIPDWFSGIYDRGIFYRDFDGSKPVVSGARWFAALAARIALAFVDALANTEIKRQLSIGVRQLWMLALVLAGWVVASVVPATAPVVDVINAILLAIGLLSLVDRAKEVGRALSDGLSAAYLAKNELELAEAGKKLAPAITGTVVTAVEVLVTNSAFAAAESVVVGRFPVPDVLARRWAKYTSRRSEPSGGRTPGRSGEPPRRQADEPQGKKGKPQDEPQGKKDKPEEEPQGKKSKPQEEPQGKKGKPGEESQKTGDRAGVLKRASRVAQLEGGRKLADPSSDIALQLLAGGAVVVGLTTAVVLLSSRSKK